MLNISGKRRELVPNKTNKDGSDMESESSDSDEDDEEDSGGPESPVLQVYLYNITVIGFYFNLYALLLSHWVSSLNESTATQGLSRRRCESHTCYATTSSYLCFLGRYWSCSGKSLCQWKVFKFYILF